MFNLRGIESVLAGAHLGHWAARAKRKHKQTCTQLTSRCADQSSDLLLRSLLTAELHARTRVTLKVEINGRIKTKTNSHAASHWRITCQCFSCCYNGRQHWRCLNDCSVVHSLWFICSALTEIKCLPYIYSLTPVLFLCLCDTGVSECVGMWIYLRCSSPRVWIISVSAFVPGTAREIAHIYRNKISTVIIINRTILHSILYCLYCTFSISFPM